HRPDPLHGVEPVGPPTAASPLQRRIVMNIEWIARHWWALVLRGIAGVIFGIIAFISPAISLAALVILFGAYAFIDGVLSLVAAARRHGTSVLWSALLLHGTPRAAA